MYFIFIMAFPRDRAYVRFCLTCSQFIDKVQRVQNAGRQTCRYAGQILLYFPGAP